MPRIDSASVMRLSRHIASASSKSTQRNSSRSVPSGDASPASSARATQTKASSSVAEFERYARAISRQSAAEYPVSSASSRFAASSGSSSGRAPPSGISHDHASSA
jgi:hypothetical protein